MFGIMITPQTDIRDRHDVLDGDFLVRRRRSILAMQALSGKLVGTRSTQLLQPVVDQQKWCPVDRAGIGRIVKQGELSLL